MQTAYLNPETHVTKTLLAIAEVDPDMLPILGPAWVLIARPNIAAEAVRYSFGPLIVHTRVDQGPRKPGGDIGWLSADLISRFRPRVYKERLDMLCGILPDLVSPTELWMVMLNAVMDAPLVSQMNELYAWATHRSLKLVGEPDPEVIAKIAGDVDPPPDDEVFGSGPLAREYRELAREIRRKVAQRTNGLLPRLGHNWKLTFRDQL